MQADAAHAGLEKSKGAFDIIGYTEHDGTHRTFSGEVQLEGSVYYFRPHSRIAKPFSLSENEIESFDVVEHTHSGEFVAVLLTAMGLFLAFLVLVGDHSQPGT